MQKLVSVIIPAYNAEEFIEEAIDSILNQTYKAIEVLIADDCSKDSTKKIIDRYTDPRVKAYHNDVNLGYLKTCNKLFALCQGDYITFQDADDYSDLTRIEKQVNAFQLDKELGICGTFAEYFDYKTREVVRFKEIETEHANILEGQYKRFQFCGASMMVIREALATVGPYRDYFNGIANEHYDWAILIVEKFKSKNIAEPLYKVRTTPNSLSRNINDRRKLFSDKIVRFLAEQRRKSGKDALMEGGNMKELQAYVAELEKPYLQDASLMFREAAIKNFYSNLLTNSINNCILAIKANPYKLLNYRLLFFYLRKMI
ncbi:glycosyltransferase family 2 protein [Rufibacter ruber]|uniref:glycosyltransferase family 2 protein n=1 Tax=Rufibacter ruber TaxID=1783499 RepID=UPI00082AF3F1|nr:glycosyltransferase family 2 protein [Rufibacter ruber]